MQRVVLNQSYRIVVLHLLASKKLSQNISQVTSLIKYILKISRKHTIKSVKQQTCKAASICLYKLMPYRSFHYKDQTFLCVVE